MLGLALISLILFSKFEIRSFSHSKDGTGAPAFKTSLDDGHAPFRDGLSFVGLDFLFSIYAQNVKSLSTPIMKMGKVMQNVENGVV